MSRAKISNKVFRIKHPKMIEFQGTEIQFNGGDEFHIVGDVLYMGGYLIPKHMQEFLINFIMNNKILFVEDTRNF